MDSHYICRHENLTGASATLVPQPMGFSCFQLNLDPRGQRSANYCNCDISSFCETIFVDRWMARPNASKFQSATKQEAHHRAMRNATPLNSNTLPIFFTREIWRRLWHCITLYAKKTYASRTTGKWAKCAQPSNWWALLFSRMGKFRPTQQLSNALIFVIDLYNTIGLTDGV